MGVFYATKNKKENKNEYNEYKATNKRSYDMSSVYLAESNSKKAIDIINEYDEKVKSNAYLSSEDLATYRSAVDSYTNSVNVVNDYAKWAGQPQSNTNWDDIIKGLNTNYDALEKYYSRWDNEDAYNKSLEQQKIEEGYLTYDSVAGQAEIDRLQEIVDEYAKIPTPSFSNSDRGGTAQAKLDAYNSAIAPIAEKYGISYEEAKKQLSEKSAYHTLAVRAQTLNEYETIEDPLFEQYVDIGKDIAPETPHARRQANRKEDNPVEAIRRDYAQEAERYGKDIADYKDTASVKYDQQVLAMTEEEVNNYNYILAKDGKKAADEYFSLIENRLNERIAGETFEEVYKDKPLLEYAFGVAAGLDQFATGVKGIFSDEYTPISKAQYVSSMIRDDLADNGAKLPDWLGGSSLGQVGYDFVTTGANMLPSILAGIVVEAALPTVGEGALVIGATTAKNIGKGVGSAVLGASAGGNAKAEMLRLGYSLEQANSYGAMVGVSEAGLEYLLGNIPGISKGDGIFSTIGTKAATKVDNAISRVAIKLGNNGTSILKAAANGAIKMTGGALDEAFEEGLQTVLETWFKEVATNVDFDDPRADEILYSSLLGAIMSFGLGGGRTIATEVNTISQGKIIQKVDGGVERLKSAGSLFSDDTVAKEIADKVNENTDAYTIGKLFYEVGATLSEQNISDIENGLRALGMSANDAKKIAREYAQHLNAWTSLTDEGKAIFSSLDPLAKVLRNKIIGENTNVYQRTAEYKDLMALADEVSNPKKANSERTPKESTEASIDDLDKQAYIDEVQRVTSDMSRETNRPFRSFVENKMSNAENVALNNVKNALGVKGVYTSNDTGATRLKNNKQRVNMVGVDSVGKNGMMLKLSDGSVVDAKDVSFSTSDEALVYEAVANMGMSANTAWEIIKGFDSKGNQKGAIYAMGALEAYTYGHNGVKVEGMSKNGFSSLLSATQKNTANKYGDIDARAKVDAKQNKIDAEYNKVRNEAKSKGKAIPKRKGDTILEFDDTKRLTELQQTQLDVLKSVAKGMGVTFHIFKSSVDDMGKRTYITADGKTTGANGWYDPKTGEIWIDLYAGNDGQGTMIFTAAHELTHFIAQWSPAKFKVFADFLLEQYGKKGQDVNELIRDQIAKAKANKRTISWDEAFEEVVADSCETFLRDSKAAEKISALHERDASLANKIKSFIGQLLAKIRKFMADPQFAPDTKEGKMVAEMTDSLQKLYDLWTDALADAGRKYSTLVDINFDTESVAPMLSERTWTASEYVTEREETAKKISKALGVDLKTAYKYIDDINGIARLIADDRARLDYEPNLDENATVLKPNSEYKYSVDMSTLCAKRLLFTGTFDAIQRALPNTVFDSEDIVSLREMMLKRGYEVACGICYVESTRREIGRITQEFIDRYKIAQQTGEPISRINSSGKEVVLKSAGRTFSADKNYTPNLGELNTTHIDIVKRDHREVYDAYLAFMNARGQAKPKLLETRAEYKGEILKHFKAKSAVEARNNAGGLRLQSFSDFEVPHMIDMMQIVMDMARVGLKSQAYTKVPAFAEVFGDSGVKINLSLIAKGEGLDSKGNLIFDDVEGINHSEAFKLRDKYSKNVGTILVGKTDAHIIAAMADPRIDYIIPFHKSSWKESLYDALGLTGYADYTDFQNEKPIDKDRKIKNFDPSEYWDFTKSGDENAQIYLEKCREDGRIPKFPQFQGYPGYWKLLIDFKMYDNDGVGSPQEVVRPIFNTEASERILGEYKGGHKSFPVAKDVVEDFVKAVNGEQVGEVGKTFEDENYEHNTPLQEEDLEDYLRTGKTKHTRDKKRQMLEEGKSPILKNRQEFTQFINDCIDGKARGESRAFAKVGRRLATAVLDISPDKTGDLYGKYIEVVSDLMKESYIRHSTAKEPGDLPLSRKDFESIPELMDNFDGITSITSHKNRTEIYLYKETDDGVVRILTITSSEKGSLNVSKLIKVSKQKFFNLFGKKIERDSANRRRHDASNPSMTATSAESLSNNIITQPEEIVNSETEKLSDRVSNKELAEMDDTALYIKNTKKANYIGMIFNGTKTEETRSQRTLDAFIGKDFYVTDGKYVYGSIVLGEPHKYTAEEFHKIENQKKHRVPKGDEYDVKPGGTKWAYPIESYDKFEKPKKLSDSKEYKNSFQARQVMYSDRSPDAVSDRVRLANALESAATNSIERQKLKEYKNTISSIGEEQAKLSDIRAEIRELTSTKGESNTMVRRVEKLLNTGETEVYGYKVKSIYKGVPNKHLPSYTIVTPYGTQIESFGHWDRDINQDIARSIAGDFAKRGAKDRISKLRFEEKQAENRINTYDRQLLRLESMKPIKDVVTREKQMAQERAVEKERELRKDALARQRARSAETTRNLLNRQKEQSKEQREKAIERRDETTLRRKLRKTIKELNSLLKNGTKKRNIKEEMKDTVATSLALAEVLFNDDIKNEDIVRLGVDSVTVQESEYLSKYRDLLDERDSLRAKIESIYANGIVRENMLAEVGEVEEEIKKLDGRIAYLNNKLSDLFERERARLNRSTIDSIINELAIEYAKLKTSENDYIKNAYNDAMQTRIESLAEALEGTVVKDMDVNQLSELYDMFKAIEHMIRHSNSLFREGRTEDLMTYVTNVQGELFEASTEQKDRSLAAEKVASFIREFSWNNLRPVDAVERLGSQTFEKLFWDFVHAMGVAARDITEAGEVIASARKKYGYSSWNMELADKPFTTRDGMTFKPSLADKLSIYAYSKREGADGTKQAMGHMVEGGFVYDTGNTYKETEKGKTYVRRKLSSTYRLSEENIQDIIDSLTTEQKGYVDAILPYLTDMGKKGNEVSMILYGIELFGEKVYYPLQSSRDYLSSTTQTLGATPTMASLANSGFTKATKSHASNPIVLRGFDDVVLEHIEKMSNYHALVIPIENLRRVFDNVGRETEGMPISTKALIGSRFGAEAQKYFEQWLTDINGGVMPSGAKNILGKLFSRAKGMSVAANLSVVAQQYFSIIRAMEVVDPKYFAPFLNGEAKKTDMKQYEELLKYAPIAIIKEMGGFDVGSNGRAKDYIGYEGARKDAKYINKKIDDLSMWGAGAMDKLGWVTIWKAVKAEVASEQKLTPGTDEFYEACRIRFTEVVTKTQVFDSIASRSGYMRSQHDAVKYATSFMGEPTAIMGRYFVAGVNLVRAIKSGNKARIKSAWGRMGRAATVIAVSGVLGNLAKSLVHAGRDDEDDEALLERWMRNFAEALRDDLNILNSLPFGRDIVSVIEGWDVERPDMTIIADMVTSAKKMLDGDITLDDSLNLVGSVGNFLGKPLKNVIREIKSAINVIGDITDDVRPTDMGGAFVEGITGDERTKMETLYDAIIRGDKSKEEVIKATYKNDTEYTSALRKALRENDPRIVEAAMAFFERDSAKRQSLIVEIENEGNFTPAIVRGAINNEIQYIKNKINDAKKAKKNGDTEEYKKIVKTLREKYPKDFVEKVLG